MVRGSEDIHQDMETFPGKLRAVYIFNFSVLNNIQPAEETDALNDVMYLYDSLWFTILGG